MDHWWVKVMEPTLNQGDYLPRCLVPLFRPGFVDGDLRQMPDADSIDASIETRDGPVTLDRVVSVSEYDLIILSQSCDLEQRKLNMVALCPIWPKSEFEAINPAFKGRGVWNEIRSGKRHGLHLLASPADPSDNSGSLVVDFREIFSLPTDYLVQRTIDLGSRWRLVSPYLEKFSQAFGQFFMRVALPSDIPKF